MHRVLLREVVIDVPADQFDATRDFWAAALDAEAEEVREHPQFTAMRHPAASSWVGLQRLTEGPARFHLDIETDDVPAEVERLIRLGATPIGRGRTWVTLVDPAGLVFDVVPFASPDFRTRSREVS
jgi:hypothetical protein